MLYAFGTKFEIRTPFDKEYRKPTLPSAVQSYLRTCRGGGHCWDIRLARPTHG